MRGLRSNAAQLFCSHVPWRPSINISVCSCTPCWKTSQGDEEQWWNLRRRSNAVCVFQLLSLHMLESPRFSIITRRVKSEYCSELLLQGFSVRLYLFIYLFGGGVFVCSILFGCACVCVFCFCVFPLHINTCLACPKVILGSPKAGKLQMSGSF